MKLRLLYVTFVVATYNLRGSRRLKDTPQSTSTTSSTTTTASPPAKCVEFESDCLCNSNICNSPSICRSSDTTTTFTCDENDLANFNYAFVSLTDTCTAAEQQQQQHSSSSSPSFSKFASSWDARFVAIPRLEYINPCKLLVLDELKLNFVMDREKVFELHASLILNYVGKHGDIAKTIAVDSVKTTWYLYKYHRRFPAQIKPRLSSKWDLFVKKIFSLAENLVLTRTELHQILTELIKIGTPGKTASKDEANAHLEKQSVLVKGGEALATFDLQSIAGFRHPDVTIDNTAVTVRIEDTFRSVKTSSMKVTFSDNKVAKQFQYFVEQRVEMCKAQYVGIFDVKLTKRFKGYPIQQQSPSKVILFSKAAIGLWTADAQDNEGNCMRKLVGNPVDLDPCKWMAAKKASRYSGRTPYNMVDLAGDAPLPIHLYAQQKCRKKATEETYEETYRNFLASDVRGLHPIENTAELKNLFKVLTKWKPDPILSIRPSVSTIVSAVKKKFGMTPKEKEVLQLSGSLIGAIYPYDKDSASTSTPKDKLFGSWEGLYDYYEWRLHHCFWIDAKSLVLQSETESSPPFNSIFSPMLSLCTNGWEEDPRATSSLTYNRTRDGVMVQLRKLYSADGKKTVAEKRTSPCYVKHDEQESRCTSHDMCVENPNAQYSCPSGLECSCAQSKKTGLIFAFSWIALGLGEVWPLLSLMVLAGSFWGAAVIFLAEMAHMFLHHGPLAGVISLPLTSLIWGMGTCACLPMECAVSSSTCFMRSTKDSVERKPRNPVWYLPPDGEKCVLHKKKIIGGLSVPRPNCKLERCLPGDEYIGFYGGASDTQGDSSSSGQKTFSANCQKSTSYNRTQVHDMLVARVNHTSIIYRAGFVLEGRRDPGHGEEPSENTNRLDDLILEIQNNTRFQSAPQWGKAFIIFWLKLARDHKDCSQDRDWRTFACIPKSLLKVVTSIPKFLVGLLRELLLLPHTSLKFIRILVFKNQIMKLKNKWIIKERQCPADSSTTTPEPDKTTALLTTTPTR